MRVTAVEPLILHMPLNRDSIADSTHRITHWGVVGVRLRTDDGLEGFGFTGTHADLSLRPPDRGLHRQLLRAAPDRRGCPGRPPPLAEARPRACAAVGRPCRHHPVGPRRRRRRAVGPSRQVGRRAPVAPARRPGARTPAPPTTPTSAGCRSRTRRWSTAAGVPSRSTASAASRSRSATTGPPSTCDASRPCAARSART